MFNIFRKKKNKPVLNKNKFNKGDKVIIDNYTDVFYICDYINEIDTTKYIVIDSNKKNLYEWIEEERIKKIW